MEDQSFTCSLDGCDGPRSGVCINNLTFDECTNVIAADEAAKEGSTEGIAQAAVDEVETGASNWFGLDAADALLRRTGAQLVALVAPPEVGKTTLLSTMYELLLRGEMNDFGFAGSETLRGYEERCFLSRTACEAARPNTQRTQREQGQSGVSFTHLRVARGASVEEILFADRSGELFDEALNSVEAFDSFEELGRADCVLFLVDIALLQSDPHEHRSKLQRSFLALEQRGLLSGRKLVLVGTKADQVGSENLEQVRDGLEAFSAKLISRVNSEVELDVLLTASRRRTGNESTDGNIESLLASLLPEKRVSYFRHSAAEIHNPSPLDQLINLVGGGSR